MDSKNPKLSLPDPDSPEWTKFAERDSLFNEQEPGYWEWVEEQLFALAELRYRHWLGELDESFD